MLRHWLTLKSRLRTNAACRRLLARVAEVRASLPPPGDHEAERTVHRIDRLCSAARLLDDAAQRKTLEDRIVSLRNAAKHSRAEWAQALVPRHKTTPQLIQKGVILKPRISDQEPGVIFISFEHQWAQLLHLPEMEQFARDYTLIVSPTWSPPHSALNVIFPSLWPQPVHCLISHEEDMHTLPRLNANYRMIPLLASNWVNEESFKPLPKSERDIDLLIVANFAPFKRHVLFFEALRHLPKEWNILLIGQKDGRRDADSLLKEARAFGVSDRFELRCSVPHPEVLKTFSRAKASAVFSMREGSCVAVMESMFADTPVGLMQGAHIGSAKYVNEHTGMFLRETDLAEDLIRLVTNSSSIHPRQHVMAFGSRSSSQILNDQIKSSQLATGNRWTSDLAEMHWCPNPQRLGSPIHGWAVSEQEHIANEYGIMIGAPAKPSDG